MELPAEGADRLRGLLTLLAEKGKASLKDDNAQEMTGLTLEPIRNGIAK